MTKSEVLLSIIATALAILCMSKSCEKEKPEITHKVDTLYIASKDPEHIITPTAQPQPVSIVNNYTTIVAAVGRIDTGAIIRDYFTKYGYKDTIKNDSIDIIIHEEAYKNHISRSKVAYRWKAPERLIKETITETKYRTGLYIGAQASWFYRQTDNNVGFGIQATVPTKNFCYTATLDPLRRFVGAGITYRIRFKKWR